MCSQWSSKNKQNFSIMVPIDVLVNINWYAKPCILFLKLSVTLWLNGPCFNSKLSAAHTIFHWVQGEKKSLRKSAKVKKSYCCSGMKYWIMSLLLAFVSCMTNASSHTNGDISSEALKKNTEIRQTDLQLKDWYMWTKSLELVSVFHEVSLQPVNIRYCAASITCSLTHNTLTWCNVIAITCRCGHNKNRILHCVMQTNTPFKQ